MKEELVNKIMDEVMKQINVDEEPAPAKIATCCGLTEFVGTAVGMTVGLVIANVDNQVHEAMKIDKRFRSIGILGARTGAGPHAFAADEAVKASNSEIASIEFARDTMGGAGHGCLIIFGAEDVSDVRRAIEVSLAELNRTFGDVYANGAGHLEFQYTARASYALEKTFGAPLGKAFGISVGAPAAIGVLMADTAVKAATVDVVGYSSPDNGGTKFSNEAILTFTGDSGAVKQAIIAAREVGLQVLEALGEEKAASVTKPYII